MAPKGAALLGGVALLEEVCHRGGGLCGFMYAQAMHSETDHFLLPAICRTPYLSNLVCLHAAMSHHDDNRLNL